MRIKIITAATIISLIFPSGIAAAEAAVSPAVVINELMWMGSSVSSVDEWLELRNLTDQTIDLSGWLLTKKSGGDEVPMLALPADKDIPAYGFFLIANYNPDQTSSVLNVVPDLVDTDISLVNSALQIKLYDATGGLIDVADDGSGMPLAGHYESGVAWGSMERGRSADDGTVGTSWRTATTAINIDSGKPELGTPRAPNGNSGPVAEAGADSEAAPGEPVSFDGSESSDPDGDPLTFAWDFGDGQLGGGPTPTHRYANAGIYLVTLTVSDSTEQASDDLTVVVAEPTEPVVPDQPDQPEDDSPTPPASPTQPDPGDVPAGNDQDEQPDPVTADLFLTELFPNPAGRDQEKEFIELYNPALAPVRLNGWTITDEKKTYYFPGATVIDGRDYLAVPYSATRLLLRNGGGAIKLIDPFGRTISGVAYSESPESQSFSRAGTTSRWQWSTHPSPGTASIFPAEDDEAGGNTGLEENNDLSDVADTESANETETANARSVSLDEISSLPGRTLVRISGAIMVEPGWFSKNTCWIIDQGIGLEISLPTGSSLKLSLGDRVSVVGRVSEAGIGRRVNAQKDGLTKTGAGELPKPEALAVSELTEETIGLFLEVEGVIKDLAATRLTLTAEDGAELSVMLKRGTGLRFTSLKKGQTARLRGVLGLGSNGLELWPRQSEDIQAAEAVLGQSDQADQTAAPIELPATSGGSSWLVPAALGLVLLATGAAYVWYRRRQPKEN